ncbi:hypothetical protein O6H91_Y509600 [Diphasiastrum complanatum]|nr:hypothetical protein O6H91_Y509600 [Diphasiastrum complanatum]
MAILAPVFPRSSSASSRHRHPGSLHSLGCRRYDYHRPHSVYYQPLHLLECKTLGYRSCERSPLKVASQHSGARALRANMDEHVSRNGCPSPVLTKPADVVREFYARVNGRKLEDVRKLIAENCVYEDFVYPKPFVGRQVR